MSLTEDDRSRAAPALHRQAALIRERAERSPDLLPADARAVVEACDERFGELSPVR